MIRLLLRLLNIRDYEVCASCETLKKQLEFVNAEKRDLTDTLLKLVNPTIIQQPISELKSAAAPAKTFSRRRAELENFNRQRDNVIKTSPFLAKPEDIIKPTPEQAISDLEKELLPETDERINNG